MGKFYFISVMLIILGCQNQSRKIDRNEYKLYSVSLIKSSDHNSDLLSCCFKTNQPTAFINKLKDYHIMEVNFPMAKKLGLSYSRWKVAKHDSDSTVFVLGLFIHNLQITGLSEDSITLLTQKLETDPRLTIILENNDSISLDRFDFQYLQNVKPTFSVNDTSWTGIEY